MTGDWLAAEREFKRALDLDPNSVRLTPFTLPIYRDIGQTMMKPLPYGNGRYELDPLSAKLHADVGCALYFARQYDQAIELYLEAIDMDPNFAPAHARLGAAYLQKGCMKRPSWSWKRPGL